MPVRWPSKGYTGDPSHTEVANCTSPHRRPPRRTRPHAYVARVIEQGVCTREAAYALHAEIGRLAADVAAGRCSLAQAQRLCDRAVREAVRR